MQSCCRDAWNNLVTGRLDQRLKLMASGGPAIVQCSADAREVLRAFHNESIRLRNGPFRDIEGELGRWRENACRMALGLCVADKPSANTLTGEQAERAVRLARWAQYSAFQVMHAGRRERRIARVDRLFGIIQEYRGEVTFRILDKSHGYTADEVERLAAEFPELLTVATKQNPKGGPQSRVLRRQP